MEKIRTRGTDFIDEHGRTRIFSGVNFPDKEGYGEGKFSLSPLRDRSLLERCRACGFNVVRLGFTWAAVEPRPSEYNEKLLDDIGEILDRAGENGIYVILDMHQDLYYESCAGGDGAPRWAALTDGCLPRPVRFVWAEGYFFHRDVQRAFDNFWTNAKVGGRGLQDRYAELWKHIAEKFKDKPALFGYDLFNEPYPGSAGGKIFRKLMRSLAARTLTDRRLPVGKMLGGLLREKNMQSALKYYDGGILHELVSVAEPEVREFDTRYYGPFLNRMAEAIRSVTDRGIIFADNCYWSNIGIPSHVPPVTVDGRVEKNVCFSPHGYDLTVDTPAYEYADNSRVDSIFDEHRRTQERLRLPVLVGEWGAAAPGTRWLPHIAHLLECFDKRFWSHTYWCAWEGFFEHPVCGVLRRAYPKAVTGKPLSYRHDREARSFALKFRQERPYEAANVLYLPKKPKTVTLNGKRVRPAYTCLSVDGACDARLRTDVGTHEIECRF